MRLSTVDAFKHLRSDSCYYLTADELSRLQETLKGILFDIADLCRANGLRYYLAGGTALGAVRHQGFIPWDDDVDILMPREDFVRLAAIVRESFPDRYWVHVPGETDGYPLLLGRILQKGTEIRTREDFFNDECGVFVDIFLLENTPDNPILRFFHGFGSLSFGFLVSCRKFFRDRSFLMQLAGKDTALRRVFSRKIFLGFFTAFLSLDQWIRTADRWNGQCRNGQSRFVAVPAGRKYYFGELYPREAFSDGADVSFEGRTLRLMRDPALYLTRLYGDYSQPPSPEHRESHAYLAKPKL